MAHNGIRQMHMDGMRPWRKETVWKIRW